MACDDRTAAALYLLCDGDGSGAETKDRRWWVCEIREREGS